LEPAMGPKSTLANDWSMALLMRSCSSPVLDVSDSFMDEQPRMETPKEVIATRGHEYRRSMVATSLHGTKCSLREYRAAIIAQ